MNTLNYNYFAYIKIVFVDAFLVLFLYLIPTLSHYSIIPIYYFDPMRILVFFGGLIMSNSKANAYILSITLPMFSYFVGGHPVFIKSALIACELLINIYLLFRLQKNYNFFISLLVSLLVSKFFYYIVKYILINYDLLQSGLISTPLYYQAIFIIFCSIIFGTVYTKKSNSK